MIVDIGVYRGCHWAIRYHEIDNTFSYVVYRSTGEERVKHNLTYKEAVEGYRSVIDCGMLLDVPRVWESYDLLKEVFTDFALNVSVYHGYINLTVKRDGKHDILYSAHETSWTFEETLGRFARWAAARKEEYASA